MLRNKVMGGIGVLIGVALIMVVAGFMVMASWGLVAQSLPLPPLSFASAMGLAGFGLLIRLAMTRPSAKPEIKVLQPNFHVGSNKEGKVSDIDVEKYISDRLREIPDEDMVKG